ncbi:MAG: 4Fe-4S dicluster domain-containing protein [Desulfocurvibacter africanus]
MSKSFFMDLTRCTACRGCQVACKQWNKNPATETTNWGSRQNPRDLNYHTFKLVRFNEVETNGELKWLFFPDQCRHCIEPPCKMVADGYDERAIIHDEETGAVVYTKYTAAIPEDTLSTDLCPYDIPRRDAKTGMWSKCTMCFDRVKEGMKPACVQSCPTGTMNFGDREEMLALAEKRLAEVKKHYPRAELVDADAVRVIVLTEEPAAQYHQYLSASADTPGMTRKQMFAKLLRPLRVFG